MYKFLNKIKTFDPMVYYLNMHIREVGRKMVKGISHNSNDFIQVSLKCITILSN